MEKSNVAGVGDRVKITLAKEEIEGILLESYEAGVVLIKLDSGYNIGVDRSNILGLKIIKKTEEKKESEKKFELSHKKPVIDLIVTGGTLSSSLDVKTGGVKFLTTPERLFQFYPEIFNLADLRIINPFMKWSENMSSEDWIKISKQVQKSLGDENVKGVIVTHGTDFLHYTASALSFFFNGKVNKPVVLTYSQRSTDRGSSDATLNLYCAAKMALSDVSEVMIVGHANSSDEYCYALQGSKVRKMHTSRRDAFKPINTSPIAKVFRDKIEILKDYPKRGKANEKSEINAVFEDKVALVKFYPGQSPEILEYYLKEGYKGLVVEMSGLGHVLTEGSKNWIPVLKKVIEKGMIVCAAPQTLYGRLDPLVYEAGRRLEKTGVIYLNDILPETALVKLGWILGFEKNKDKIKELLLKNIAKEFNERLGEEFI
jgi:glutamyl-tRNA(Gln) amidotransferase subunit D